MKKTQKKEKLVQFQGQHREALKIEKLINSVIHSKNAHKINHPLNYGQSKYIQVASSAC